MDAMSVCRRILREHVGMTEEMVQQEISAYEEAVAAETAWMGNVP